VKAYCAPGTLPIAELLLALYGDKPDELAEHPWLEGISGVILIADLPELEPLEFPAFTAGPPLSAFRLPPPLARLLP
jgi:hypothetical protein